MKLLDFVSEKERKDEVPSEYERRVVLYKLTGK